MWEFFYLFWTEPKNFKQKIFNITINQVMCIYWGIFRKHTGRSLEAELLKAGHLSQIMSASTGKKIGEEEGYTGKLVTTTITHAILESNMCSSKHFHNTT